MSRFSAMRAFAPPRPSSRATAVRRWRRNSSSSFIGLRVRRYIRRDKIANLLILLEHRNSPGTRGFAEIPLLAARHSVIPIRAGTVAERHTLGRVIRQTRQRLRIGLEECLSRNVAERRDRHFHAIAPRKALTRAAR